ncbi:MAG: hypothetical protein JWP82_306 [Humibacillus sp.]|nr:hypothetical protein [Humibacillus sp.]
MVMTSRSTSRRVGLVVTGAVVACLGLVGCGRSAVPGPAVVPGPGAATTLVVCPASGPVRASELGSLSTCDLGDMQIVIDVGSERGYAGAVQNLGECSVSSEGAPVIVCTFASPVGTGGSIGEKSDRVWFGSDEAIARMRSAGL